MGWYMPMELLVICAVMAIVVILALRYGYDSRSGIQSKEEELACFGMTWDAAALRVADLRREAAQERLLREALLGDSGKRRSAAAGVDVDGDRGRAATPRRPRPIATGDHKRVAQPAGEQSALRQRLEIASRDAPRALPEPAVRFAQFDAYRPIDGGLLADTVDQHEINT